MPAVTLVTRHDCCLCDEMAAIVRQVGEQEELSLEVRDVDADEELLRLYGDQVPVLLVNGRRAFKYRVTARQLRRRLRAEAGTKRASWWRRRPSEPR